MENLLYLLPALACPIGMGLMMWLMMRHNQPTDVVAGSTVASAGPKDRLAELRAQLSEVQAQQAAITARIAGLSTSRQTDEAEATRPGAVAGTKGEGEEVPR